jgi:hypothetical protein
MDDEQALNLARQAEFLLDLEIDRLNNLQTEDYEVIREKRLQLMKLQHQQQQLWLANGHGSYTYVSNSILRFAFRMYLLLIHLFIFSMYLME